MKKLNCTCTSSEPNFWMDGITGQRSEDGFNVAESRTSIVDLIRCNYGWDPYERGSIFGKASQIRGVL